MRWRLVDRIDGFTAWTSIRGRKCVSLEEYSLLERFDRNGVFPESLALESFVHLGRWLAMASSRFEQSALLAEVEGFSFRGELGRGSSLHMEITVEELLADRMALSCQGRSEQAPLCDGKIVLSFHALHELVDPEASRMLWQELHGKAE